MRDQMLKGEGDRQDLDRKCNNFTLHNRKMIELGLKQSRLWSWGKFDRLIRLVVDLIHSFALN